ncbi:hypothetical protein [Thalassolituus oleivorans]|uniref:Uncharacterized protein n=1 Tax=Thalassolituus oleivorans MIL-1 TaxID=1298593 RepID=M5DN79_9GAMM|nr:hypothetical protein [Thalassolituus oleivorans]CCU70903.1 hypothetical protein TOL_0464 [Thalassolituus oleivorans MIL-1]
MTANKQPNCQVCEDTGIDDRTPNYRACDQCRKGRLLYLNHLRLKAEELQQAVYSTEREITALEKSIPLVEA